MIRPEKIVSGGQSGTDRAGLDFARSAGIPHGGWCPLGRRSEDGQIPPEYSLTETLSPHYRDRTTRNIQDSDATIVFIDGSLGKESGSALTLQLCRMNRRPNLLINLSLDSVEDSAKLVQGFARDRQIKILNIAGSRASISPSIGAKVVEVLKLAFSETPPEIA
jgi:hypothetical protein